MELFVNIAMPQCIHNSRSCAVFETSRIFMLRLKLRRPKLEKYDDVGKRRPDELLTNSDELRAFFLCQCLNSLLTVGMMVRLISRNPNATILGGESNTSIAKLLASW